MKSAEDRFVEAMRDIYKATTPSPPGDPLWADWIKDAIEAFADMVCEADPEPHCHPDAVEHRLGWRREKMHESCRAVLLKKVMG